MVRYLIRPERIVHLDPADAVKRRPNFLVDELPQRVEQGPRFPKIEAGVFLARSAGHTTQSYAPDAGN